MVTYLLKRYGVAYEERRRDWLNRPIISIKLGGAVLTPEAQRIKNDKSIRTLLDDANGKVENVFTMDSLANVHTKALIYFIILQSCGTLALLGASILLG